MFPTRLDEIVGQVFKDANILPHLVHPRKAVDLPERIPPSASGIWGGCSEQVSNPPNSIGTAVQHVTGCGLAPLSPGDTTLQHSQSPGCTGCLLRGPLAVTTTRLPPVSRRQLSGHTSDGLGGASFLELSWSVISLPVHETACACPYSTHTPLPQSIHSLPRWDWRFRK